MSYYDNLNLMPHRVSGWTEQSSIFPRLLQEVRPQHIIEVGTWLGASAFRMARLCKELGLNTKITCVDTWLGALEFYTHPDMCRDLMLKNGYPQVYYQFLSNVVHEGLTDVITPFPITSSIAARWFTQQGIKADLVYIDASHDYEDVLADIKAYHGLGRVMFGDDCVTHWPGVQRAVEECKIMLPGRWSVEEGFWVCRPN